MKKKGEVGFQRSPGIRDKDYVEILQEDMGNERAGNTDEDVW